MREGAQMTYEAAIWEVMQTYPGTFQQDMMEPMEPGMVSHAENGPKHTFSAFSVETSVR